MTRYKLAPMDQYMKRMTNFCLLIPVFFFLVGPLLPYLLICAFLIVFIYSVIWFRMRPKSFVIDDENLTIEWPVGKKSWKRSEISSVEYMPREKFKETYGFGIRVGAGGLWGGFGRYQTTDTTFRMFVSRIDGFVIVNFREGRPLMITPENPESFMKSVTLT